MIKKKKWQWFWGIPEDRIFYVHKSYGLFPLFVLFILVTNPTGIGRWAGTIAHAFKEVF